MPSSSTIDILAPAAVVPLSSSHHPPSYPFVQSFERDFQYEPSRRWLQQHNHLPIIAIIVYLLFIYSGQRWLKDRPGFKLRGSLFLWNTLLAAFSIAGALRSLQEFFHVTSHEGLHASICIDHKRNGVHAFWSFAFVVSKLLELGDTVFIVLRKTDLIFLHWWHHVTVIIFGWFSGSQDLSLGRWIMSLNFTVHAFMYSYYALRIAGVRVNRLIAMSITSMQIGQMLIGLSIILYAGIARLSSTSAAASSCQTSDRSLLIGLICYASYFWLFCRFFARSYMQRKVHEVDANRSKALDTNSNIKSSPGKQQEKKEKAV